MRKNRVIEQNRCYHLVSRLAHRAFFLDDGEKDRAVALMRRVEAGAKASMSYCINRTVSISSDPFDPHYIWREKKMNRLYVFYVLLLLSRLLYVHGATKAPDADNVAACSGVELSLEVTFSNDCTKALVVFSLTNATDKICRIVETSFPEKDFDLAIASADNSPVPLRKDALIEEVRRSETLRRVAVDVMPHSEYRRHGDFLSFYELKQNSWYVARGTCTVFQKDANGKTVPMCVVAGHKEFKTP